MRLGAAIFEAYTDPAQWVLVGGHIDVDAIRACGLLIPLSPSLPLTGEKGDRDLD